MVQVAPCSPATIAGRRGNLAAAAVSNAMRTRATSHPCERGAGFLQSIEQPRKPAPQIQKVRSGFAEVCDVRRRTETRRLWCAARLLCGWRRGAEGAATENQATRIGAISGGAECAPGGRGDRAAVCEASADGEAGFCSDTGLSLCGELGGQDAAAATATKPPFRAFPPEFFHAECACAKFRAGAGARKSARIHSRTADRRRCRLQPMHLDSEQRVKPGDAACRDAEDRAYDAS